MPKPTVPESVAKRTRSASVFEKTIRKALANAGDHQRLRHLYLSRAGEWFVASQLLRRGLNAGITSVDSGVDILAHQEAHYGEPLLQAEHVVFQFQVKTTASNEYRVALPVHRVHELWHKVINLVFVFWPEGCLPACLVIPPSLLCMFTSGGFDDVRAPLRLRDGLVTLRVGCTQGRYFIRNHRNDITPLLNRFDLVEPIGTDTSMLPPYATWAEGKGLVAIDENPACVC